MSLHDATTPRLALLQRRFPTPSLSPLAALVDRISQDAQALDLMIDNTIDTFTPDESVDYASLLAMLLTVTKLLRESTDARERRLLSDGTGAR